MSLIFRATWTAYYVASYVATGLIIASLVQLTYPLYFRVVTSVDFSDRTIYIAGTILVHEVLARLCLLTLCILVISNSYATKHSVLTLLFVLCNCQMAITG